MQSIETGTPRLLGQKAPPVGWLVFNNPERRNALSLDMWSGIPRVLAHFAADPEVRVAILKGEGGAAFVAGADISQFEAERASPEANQTYSAVTDAGFAAIEHFPKPSIAMISGFCIGGGMAVALNCDIRIASEDSTFAIPAARLGLGYAFEGVEKLTQIVGPAFASEILFTARRLTAEEALRMGLINRMTSKDELEAVTMEYAAQIGGNAPLTVRAAKMAVGETQRPPDQRNLAAVSQAVDACFASQDFKEGRMAFMEKRRPRFEGR